MEPANPPLPTLRNLPFQSEAGNHTSKRISESGLGRMTPARRQNAGSLSRGLPEGGVNLPAGTACAVVRVVFGSFTPLRLAQSAAWPARADAARRRGSVAKVRVGRMCMYLSRRRFPRAPLRR